jgi:ribosomal protein S18 acetylase RimI-like enzyme
VLETIIKGEDPMPEIVPEVRRATMADAAEIARLADQLGYPAAPDETKRRLEVLLESARHHIAVVDAPDGRLAGWIQVEQALSLEGGDRAEIMGLVVDVAARRRGIGAALVAEAERRAATLGLGIVCVRSNVTRELSHPFYERLGYVREKTQHVYRKRCSNDGSD